ncbi:MAG: hypothetical protein QM740_02500 [Acidovorax sp.]
MTGTYHAPHFDPTVDELHALKLLEMGQHMDLHNAHKEHLSGRLLERGYVTRNGDGEMVITTSGRDLIRRQ